MGTSKAYGTPKWPGVNQSVGAAAEAGDSEPEKMVVAIGAFANAFRTYLMGAPSSSIGQSSVGGKKAGIASSGPGGRALDRALNGGTRLATLLQAAQELGTVEAFKQFDLSDYRDNTLDDFLTHVADALLEEGGLLDNDALGRAMARTIDELASEAKTPEEFEIILQNTKLDIEGVLQMYYCNVIFMNFEQKEYSVVRDRISKDKTEKFFRDAYDIIRAKIRDELSIARNLSGLNWNSEDGRAIATEINNEVLTILIPNDQDQH